jgi:hypothetical protein
MARVTLKGRYVNMEDARGPYNIRAEEAVIGRIAKGRLPSLDDCLSASEKCGAPGHRLRPYIRLVIISRPVPLACRPISREHFRAD